MVAKQVKNLVCGDGLEGLQPVTLVELAYIRQETVTLRHSGKSWGRVNSSLYHVFFLRMHFHEHVCTSVCRVETEDTSTCSSQGIPSIFEIVCH